MTTPQRIQMRRTKGWQKPANTVYVGRPSKWGNPYKPMRAGGGWGVFRVENVKGHGRLEFWIERFGIVESFDDALAEALRLYRRSMAQDMHDLGFDDDEHPAAEYFAELRGKNLACWCPLDQPCHADVLLELANAEAI